MDPQLQKAVAERIKDGKTQAAISSELQSAGYEPAEAERIYQTVHASLSRAAQPAATAPTSEPTPAEQPQAAATTAPATPAPQPAPPTNTSTTAAAVTTENSHHTGLWIAGVIVMAVLAAGAVAAYTLDMRQVFSSLPFISIAPYNEVTLLPGIATENPDTMTVTTDFGLYLEERDPDVVGHEEIDEFFAGLTMLGGFMGISFPEEASIVATSEFDFDFRPLPIDLDGSSELAIDFDIFNIDSAGSLRMADSVVYGRIDRLPALMQGELDTIPMNEWIIILDDGDLLEQELVSVVQNELWSTIADGFVGSLLTLFNDEIQMVWRDLPDDSRLASPFTASTNITASAIESLDWLPEPLRPDEEDAEEMQLVVDAVQQTWQSYPLIAFRTDPYRERVAGESVYVYEVKLAVDNVHPFFEELIATLPDELVVEQDMETLLEEMPEREEMELFNELFTARLDVRPDGTLHRTLVEGLFAGLGDEFTQQLRLHAEVIYTNEGEDFNITAPADVHEKTLNELMMEQMFGSGIPALQAPGALPNGLEEDAPRSPGAFGGSGSANGIDGARLDAQDASVKQTLHSLIGNAELYYNSNRFSYQGLCAEIQDLRVSSDISTDCSDAVESYAVMSELPSGGAYCVDSSGARTELSAYVSLQNSQCPESDEPATSSNVPETTPTPPGTGSANDLPGAGDDVVATVNGIELTQSEYDRIHEQVRQTAEQRGMDLDSADTVQEVNDQAMDTLVNTELISQAAVAAGGTVTAAEVEARFAEVVDSLGSAEVMAENLERLGITEESLRSDIEQELLIQGYLDEVISVDYTPSEAEVQAYYEEQGGAAQLPPLDQVRDQIIQQLIAAEEQVAIEELLEELRLAADIETMI